MTKNFWCRVYTGAVEECWPWAGSTDTRGYGNLSWGGKRWTAHRLAYTLANGPIPKASGHHGVVVMHRCDNRICCNPNHLTLGTHAENMADMVVKGRANRAPGEENGRAVLTAKQVAEIRTDPRGTRTICKDYPVSRSAVQRIKAGKAWVST